jgi:hypothetical protein
MTFTQLVAAVTDHCNLGSSTEAVSRVGRSINRHYRRITASLNIDTARFGLDDGRRPDGHVHRDREDRSHP